MAENAVATPSPAYAEMAQHWAIIDAVRGGTPAMRGSSDFLPKEPMEEESAYRRRKSKTTFTPWYERLVAGLVGMVLRKPITFAAEIPEAIAPHIDDLNLQGDNLQMLASDLLETALDYGTAAIFVDYPDATGVQTLREEKERGLRPYWVLYRGNEIIGYRTVQEGGAEVLTQLRVLQTICEEDGEFGEIETQQVRVYQRDESGVTCTLYRPEDPEKPDSDWMLHDGPLPLSLPYIPCALLSCVNKKRAKKRPPMLEVAYLNLKHYQLSSDLDHALHLTMHPKLALFGYDEGNDILGTSDEALIFTKTDARAEWLVCQVGSLEFGSDRIDKIEQQMATLGLSTILNQKNVGETAEAKRIDRSQGNSIMSGIAQNLQNTLDNALRFHADYLNLTEPLRVLVNRDFDISQITPQMLSAVVAAVAQGRLSTETFHEILMRGEVGLSDEWSPELEQTRLRAEFAQESTPQTVGIEADL